MSLSEFFKGVISKTAVSSESSCEFGGQLSFRDLWEHSEMTGFRCWQNGDNGGWVAGLRRCPPLPAYTFFWKNEFSFTGDLIISSLGWSPSHVSRPSYFSVERLISGADCLESLSQRTWLALDLVTAFRETWFCIFCSCQARRECCVCVCVFFMMW